MFFNADEQNDSIRFLIEANNTGEWMCSFYFKYMKAIIICMIMTTTVSMFLCRLILGDINVENLYTPTPAVYAHFN